MLCNGCFDIIIEFKLLWDIDVVVNDVCEWVSCVLNNLFD